MESASSCDVSPNVSFDFSAISLKIRLDLWDWFHKSSSFRSTSCSWVLNLLIWRSSFTCAVTLSDRSDSRSSFVSCYFSITSFMKVLFFFVRSRASFSCVSTLPTFSISSLWFLANLLSRSFILVFIVSIRSFSFV